MKDVLLVEVVNKSNNLLPEYSSEGAFAMDLRASEDISIPYLQTRIVKTDLFMAVPEGYALRIVDRSGLASKGIKITNSPATIDEDYRGPVGVIMTNLSTNNDYIESVTGYTESFVIKAGDRIAQCYLERKIPFKFVNADELSETKRGIGGFGSTGIK
jgi:dUTP pyrophosphatase